MGQVCSQDDAKGQGQQRTSDLKRSQRKQQLNGPMTHSYHEKLSQIAIMENQNNRIAKESTLEQKQPSLSQDKTAPSIGNEKALPQYSQTLANQSLENSFLVDEQNKGIRKCVSIVAPSHLSSEQQEQDFIGIQYGGCTYELSDRENTLNAGKASLTHYRVYRGQIVQQNEQAQSVPCIVYSFSIKHLSLNLNCRRCPHLLHEIDIYKTLGRNQNVLQVYGCIRWEQRFYVFLEDCACGSLQQFLSQQANEPLHETQQLRLSIAQQMCKILLKMHTAKVAHCALDANAFLIQREGGAAIVKLRNFFFSKKVQDQPTLQIRQNEIQGSLYNSIPKRNMREENANIFVHDLQALSPLVRSVLGVVNSSKDNQQNLQLLMPTDAFLERQYDPLLFLYQFFKYQRLKKSLSLILATVKRSVRTDKIILYHGIWEFL